VVASQLAAQWSGQHRVRVVLAARRVVAVAPRRLCCRGRSPLARLSVSFRSFRPHARTTVVAHGRAPSRVLAHARLCPPEPPTRPIGSATTRVSTALD
jgi:hypothetical protein